jgi:hypothetical protein
VNLEAAEHGRNPRIDRLQIPHSPQRLRLGRIMMTIMKKALPQTARVGQVNKATIAA